MARSVATIYNAAVTQYVANAVAAGVTPAPNPAAWSKYNYQSLIFWTMAFCQSLLEQIQDAFTSDVEAVVATASPQSFGWLQAMMLKFQFSATTPQLLQFNTTTFAPYYPTVNPALQVIAFASVVPASEGTTLIKVAASVSGAPQDLDTAYAGALAAAQSYVNTLGVPGIIYNVQSGAADNLFMQMDVFYNGLYTSMIQANVMAAINAYMQTQTAANPNGIPFNGVVTLSNLEAAIKAVPGVIDMIWGTVAARKATTIAPAYDETLVTATLNPNIIGAVTPTNTILNNTQTQRVWSTVAGYIIPEKTPGYTLTDFRDQVHLSGALNLNFITA